MSKQKATVRVHGQVDPVKLHNAAIKFIKKQKEGKKQ